MARVDRNVDRFLTKLSGDLRSESLSPEQVASLSGAIASLPEGARITAKELDKIAKDLQLPKQHSATLVFALFFQRYGSLVRDEIKDERVLAKGLASVLGALIDRTHKKDGAAVAAALSEFFVSFAGPAAAIAGTGVDLSLGSTPKLELEGDRVRVIGRQQSVRWQDLSFSISISGRPRGALSHDESRGWVYRDTPIAKLGSTTLACLDDAVSRWLDGGVKLEDAAAANAQKAIYAARCEATGTRELFQRYDSVEATVNVPLPHAPQELGAFVSGAEGGWAFRKSKTESIPLGRLSIDTLKTLSTALSEEISSPPRRSGKADPKQAMAHARSIAFAGSLLTDVARTLDAKIKEEQTARASSETALRAALKDYRVAHIGAESMNALVRAFGSSS